MPAILKRLKLDMSFVQLLRVDPQPTLQQRPERPPHLFTPALVPDLHPDCHLHLPAPVTHLRTQDPLVEWQLTTQQRGLELQPYIV